MATFFSKHRELRLTIGEDVRKSGDKEMRIPKLAVFKDNIFKTNDEELIKLLRAHDSFGKSAIGGFHETDEKTDREALLKSKQIVEQGERVDLGSAVKLAEQSNKRKSF